jgi:hypothetical protein
MYDKNTGTCTLIDDLIVKIKNGQTVEYFKIEKVNSIRLLYDVNENPELSPMHVFSIYEPSEYNLGSNWLDLEVYDYEKDIEVYFNGLLVLKWDSEKEEWIFYEDNLEKLFIY